MKKFICRECGRNCELKVNLCNVNLYKCPSIKGCIDAVWEEVPPENKTAKLRNLINGINNRITSVVKNEAEITNQFNKKFEKIEENFDDNRYVINHILNRLD